MATGVGRPAAAGRLLALLLLPWAGGCGDTPLAPGLEPGGEPGPAVWSSAGAFQPLSYPATGSARYVLDAGGNAALSLSADFSVPAVPGTAVFLAHDPGLEEAVKVADLPQATGPQRWTFRVPRGAIWSWVVVWSEELGVGVAAARLRPES